MTDIKSNEEWQAFLQSPLTLLWEHLQELTELQQAWDEELNYANCRVRLKELQNVIASRPINSLEDAIVKMRLLCTKSGHDETETIAGQFLRRLLLATEFEQAILFPTGPIDQSKQNDASIRPKSRKIYP